MQYERGQADDVHRCIAIHLCTSSINLSKAPVWSLAWIVPGVAQDEQHREG